MNRQIIRTCISSVTRKPRLYDQAGNKYYIGYIQNSIVFGTITSFTPVAYLFQKTAPKPGIILIDRLDGQQYIVRQVKRYGCNKNDASFELVLSTITSYR